jgi:hypothetical protein
LTQQPAAPVQQENASSSYDPAFQFPSAIIGTN